MGMIQKNSSQRRSTKAKRESALPNEMIKTFEKEYSQQRQHHGWKHVMRRNTRDQIELSDGIV